MKSVIIFGTGEVAHQILNFIGAEKVSFFVDNKEDKVGKFLEGIEIISFKRLIEIHENYEVIIGTGIEYTNEIANQLKDVDIPCSTYYDFPFYMVNGQKHFVSVEEITSNNKLYLQDDICIWGDNLYARMLAEELRYNKKNVYLVDCKKDYLKKDIGYFLNKYSVHVLCISNDNVILGKEKTENYRYQILTESNKIIVDCFDQDCFEKTYYNPKIEQYKDKYKGRRCFIIGNGPSLKTEDLELLYNNNEITFGLNRIYKIFNKTNWRPTFFCFVDYLMICNSIDEIISVDCDNKFIFDYYNVGGENCPKKREDFIYLHVNCMKYEYKLPKFSFDASRTLYMGYSVSYIALQLACYMGFSEIYLLGMDHSLSVQNYRDDHFIKGYFLPNEKTYELHQDAITLAFKKAAQYTMNKDTKIYNATRGGFLEVFQRVSFDEVVRK